MLGKKIIVGLGNPGISYERTRHNAGMLFCDNLRRLYRFPEFKLRREWRAMVSQGVIGERGVVLVQPQTFMNLSGEAVRAVIDFYKLSPSEDLLVAYDDLDLVMGKYQLSATKFPKVHNGILSLKQHLGALDFLGLRLGIDGRAGERVVAGSDYVLSNFSGEQLQLLERQVFPAAWQEVQQTWL